MEEEKRKKKEEEEKIFDWETNSKKYTYKRNKGVNFSF